MDESEGSAVSLELNDALRGSSHHSSRSQRSKKPPTRSASMELSSTTRLAQNAQVNALGMVLDESATGGDTMNAADMIAKQHAAIGRSEPAAVPQPGAFAYTPSSSNPEDVNLQFEMSSTTRFAQMGQQHALAGIVDDLDEDELAKQQARHRLPSSMPPISSSSSGTLSTPTMAARSQTVDLRERQGMARVETEVIQQPQASVRPGAYSVQGGTVVSLQHTGVLTDAAAAQQQLRHANNSSMMELKAAVGGAPQYEEGAMIGAIAQEGANPDLRKEKAKKKDDAYHTDVEIADVALASTDKSFKWNRKYTIGVAVLVVIIAGIGIGVGVSSGGGSDTKDSTDSNSGPGNEMSTSAPDPCDFEALPNPSFDLQCSCGGEISIVDKFTRRRYFDLREIIPDDFIDVSDNSCTSENLALFRIAEMPDVDLTGVTSVTERFALTVLVEATGGPVDWPLTDWTTNSPVCEWQQVVCVEQGVTELNLTALELVGTIPSQLSLLASMEVLNLEGNQISGSIPAAIMSLPTLQAFRANSNKLTGSIPTEVGLASSLVSFHIETNEISGILPTEMGNLVSTLSDITVNDNLIGGNIPSEIGNLASLKVLTLARNRGLGGRIPSEVGKLGALQILALDGHFNLKGTLPTEMGNMSSLTALSLFNSDVSGTIPTEFGMLASLEVLVLGSNPIGGTLPSELGNLGALRILVVASNPGVQTRISGELPLQLWNLASLEYFDASGQRVSGTLAEEMFSMPKLKSARLRSNSFSGEIPEAIVDVEELLCLDISQNPLINGNLPTGICNKKGFQVVVDCSGGVTMLDGCECCKCGSSESDPCAFFLAIY